MKKLTQFLQLTLLRASFRLWSLISPQLAATRALKLMSTPRILPEKPREQIVMKKAQQSTFAYRDGKVQRYRWGNGEKTALLVHGWEGRAGNFGNIIETLLAAGWTVLAFDAPSHGQSDRQPSSMFDFGECLRAILEEQSTSGQRIDAVIAHSFGCVATVLALIAEGKLAPQKLVMIASPNRFEDRLQQVVDLIQLPPRSVAALRPMLLAQTDYPIFEFDIASIGEQLNIPERLLLHDKDDRVSLFEWSQEIAQKWSANLGAKTKLITISGTGHNRILWDANVTKHIVDFLSAKATVNA